MPATNMGPDAEAICTTRPPSFSTAIEPTRASAHVDNRQDLFSCDPARWLASRAPINVACSKTQTGLKMISLLARLRPCFLGEVYNLGGAWPC